MQALVRAEVRLACRAATHQRAYDQTRGWNATPPHSALHAAAAAAAARQPRRCGSLLVPAHAAHSPPPHAPVCFALSPLAVAVHRRCLAVAAGALPLAAAAGRGRGCARLPATAAAASRMHTHSRRQQAATDATPAQPSQQTPPTAPPAASSPAPPLPSPALPGAPKPFASAFSSTPSIFAASKPSTMFATGGGFSLPGMHAPASAATPAAAAAAAPVTPTAAPIVPPGFKFSVPPMAPSFATPGFGGLRPGGFSLPPAPAATPASASAAAATPVPAGQAAAAAPAPAAPSAFGFSLPPPAAGSPLAPAPPFVSFRMPLSAGNAAPSIFSQQPKATLSPAAAAFEAKAAAAVALPPITPAPTDAAAAAAAAAPATPGVPVTPATALPFLQFNATPVPTSAPASSPFVSPSASSTFGNATLTGVMAKLANAGAAATRKSAAVGSIKLGAGAALAATKPALEFADLMRVTSTQKKTIEQELEKDAQDAQQAQADEAEPDALSDDLARDRLERTRPPGDRLRLHGHDGRITADEIGIINDKRIMDEMANDALLSAEEEQEDMAAAAAAAAAPTQTARPALSLNTDVSLDPRAPLPAFAEGDFPHLSMSDWKRLREDAGLSDDMLDYVRYQSEARVKYTAAVEAWKSVQEEIDAEREAERKAQRRAAGRAALEDARAGIVRPESLSRRDNVAKRLQASQSRQREQFDEEDDDNFESMDLDRTGELRPIRPSRRMLKPFVRAMAEPLHSISANPPALWPLQSRIGYMEMQQRDVLSLRRLQKQREAMRVELIDRFDLLVGCDDEPTLEELKLLVQNRETIERTIANDTVVIEEIEKVLQTMRESLAETEMLSTDYRVSARISTAAKAAGMRFDELASTKAQLAVEVQALQHQMGVPPSEWFGLHATQMEAEAAEQEAAEKEAAQAAFDDPDALDAESDELDAQMAAAADAVTVPGLSMDREPDEEEMEETSHAPSQFVAASDGLTQSILWDAPLSLDRPGALRDLNPNVYTEFAIEEGNRILCFPGEKPFLLDAEGNHIDNDRNIIRSKRRLEKLYPMHDFGDADSFREQEDEANDADELAALVAAQEAFTEEELQRQAEEEAQRRQDRMSDENFMDATHEVVDVEQTPNVRPSRRPSSRYVDEEEEVDEDEDEEGEEEEEEDEESEEVFAERDADKDATRDRARRMREAASRRARYARARDFDDDLDDDEEEMDYRGSSRSDMDEGSFEDRRSSGEGHEEFRVPKASSSSGGGSVSKSSGPSSAYEADEPQFSASMDVEQLDFEQTATNYDSRASKTAERPEVEVHTIQTLASFAASMSVSVRDITTKLRELDLQARGSSGLIKEDVARLLAEEYGFTPVKSAVVQPQELASLRRKSLKSEQYLSLPLRAPVICVMGHVDHGKTTLLDRLRSENRAAGEAGGITQAIGAFRVNLTPDASAPAAPVEVAKDNLDDVESPEERALREEIEAEEATAKATEALAKASSLVNTSGSAEPHSERPTYATFLDTPGHAAFKNMRAKGASSSCTDLVILVISAVDGLMPQTLEVIQLARKANLPLIIAINKCDVSGADPNAIKKQLFVHDVVVEDMGGEVLSCNISAKTGEGIQQLKELIAVTAEILQLHADRSCPAEAYVIESRIHKKGGCVASILVRNGSVRVGQHFVCGLQHGRIRALHDENDKPIRDAVINPGEAAQLFGLKSLDDLTEDLYIVESEARALEVIQERIDLLEADESELISDMQAQNQADQKAQAYKIQVTRRKKRVAIRPLTLDEAASKALVDNAVPVMVKADVSGSLEVLMEYFSKLPQDEVMCSIMKQGLGEITVQDVEHAVETGGSDAAGVPLASIFGFNVKPSADAALLAKQRGLKIYTHAVIYSLWDDIRDVLSERLPTEMVESSLGTASVQQLFPLSGEKKKKVKAPVVLPASRNPLAHLGADPTPEAVAAAEAVLAEQAQKAAEEAAAAQAEADAPAMVAGCRVKHGKLDAKMQFRVKREEESVISDLSCVSLRINKESKPVVEKGLECGIRLSFGFDSRIRVGDTIECYTMVKKEKTLDDAAARGFISEQEGGQFDVTQQAASYQ